VSTMTIWLLKVELIFDDLLYMVILWRFNGCFVLRRDHGGRPPTRGIIGKSGMRRRRLKSEILVSNRFFVFDQNVIQISGCYKCNVSKVTFQSLYDTPTSMSGVWYLHIHYSVVHGSTTSDIRWHCVYTHTVSSYTYQKEL